MTRETISLLSSSPVPATKQLPKCSTKPLQTSRTNSPLVNSSNTTVPPRHKWVEISSDDDGYNLPTQPSAASINNCAPAFRPSTLSNLVQPLSDDDDDPYILPALPVDTAQSTVPAHNPTPLATTKRDREFYYLSEDFDTTIDLDESVHEHLGPPAKKARDGNSAATMAGAAALQRLESSNLGVDSNAVPSTTSTNALGAKKVQTSGKGRILDSDPIMFTSSPDPYLEAANKKAARRKALSKKPIRDDILPDLSSDPPVSTGIDPLPITTKPRSKVAQTAWGRYEAERQKDKKKAMKPPRKRDVTSKAGQETVIEREKEKERKMIARENKAKEKDEKAKEKARAAELAKVNTLRTDKKVSAPEMIVDLPSSLEGKVKAQTEALLDGLSVEHQEWDSSLPIVKFRRKVNAEYNEKIDLWEPVALRIKEEKHIIYVMAAQQFIDLVVSEKDDDNFDLFILQLKAKFDSCRIILLIQGYNVFIKKNRNVKNRQFAQNVRSVGEHPEEAIPTASQARKRKKPEYINEDLLEEAMLSLQTAHELLVHHTNVPQETSEQLAVFTQQISTVPYKSQRQSSSMTFCMDQGQVKTGDGPQDTYLKMLQEIVRLTAPIAYGIQAEYPTLPSLIEGCLKNGPSVVEDCRKSANKDGAFTDRKIGPAISRRVWKVFTGRDVNSIDV